MAACRRAVMRWANRCTATHSLPPGRAARGMGGAGVPRVVVAVSWGSGGGCGWCWCPNGVAEPQDNGSDVLGVVAVSQMWWQCLGVLAVSKGGVGVPRVAVVP